MKNQHRKIVLSLTLLFIASCFLIPLQAVNPAKYSSEISTQKISEQPNSLASEDLSWKEKLALKLLDRKIKKARKKWSKAERFPSNSIQENRCYTMVLKNGEERKILLIGVSETEVVFKPCENPEAPEITIPIEEVGQIKDQYNNLMYEASDYTPPAPPETQPKMERFALAAIISAAIGLGLLRTGIIIGLVFLGLALLLSLISFARFINHPDKFWGRGFSLVAAIIAIIFLALILPWVIG